MWTKNLVRGYSSTIVLLLLLLLTSCIGDDKEMAIERVAVGDALPLFTVTTTQGDTFTTTKPHNRPVIVLFFLTTCKDCQQFMPIVEQLWREQQPTPSFDLIAIGREESAEVVSDYWRDNALTIPVSPQTDRTVFSLFATQDIPRLYIATPDLRVTHIFTPSTLPTLNQLKEILNTP